MNEVLRGTYTLVVENPKPTYANEQPIRKVLVHDFEKPKVHIRHRMEMLIMELRKDLRFRRPGEFGAWKGHWETTVDDWRLFLQHWDHAPTDGIHGSLFGYPVIVL